MGVDRCLAPLVGPVIKMSQSQSESPRRLDRGENTRLHGWSLLLARLAWSAIFAACLGSFIAGLPAHFNQLLTVSNSTQLWMQLSPKDERVLSGLGLDIHFYAFYLVAFEILAVAGYAALGLFIFWRRSDDRMAIFVSVVSIIYGTTSVPVLQSLAQSRPDWLVPLTLLNSIGLGSAVLLFFRFPDGRFVPGWTLWLGVFWVTWALLWPFFPAINPDRLVFPLPILVKLIWYGVGIGAQIYRYKRHSTLVEQQQTKWAVLGFTAAFVGFFLFNLGYMPLFPAQTYGLPYAIYMLIGYPLLILVPSFLAPVSLGLAILHYRLWDIDFIINRSLVYATLTGILAGIYGASVIILQQVFRNITGIGDNLAIVTSTLAIAVLFAPLRNRIQRSIDRRFYRKKYNMAQMLTEFSAKMRDEVDLDRLSEDLLDIVQRTMQPAHIALWLRSTGDTHPPSTLWQWKDKP